MDMTPVFADVMEGEDVNARFLRAAASSKIEYVERVITEGPSLGAYDLNGDNALMRAGQYNSRQVADLFIELGLPLVFENRDGRTLLHVFAKNGWADLVEKALDAGADIDARDRNGNTPLIDAASRGRVDAARVLIGRGANTHAQNLDGNSPASYLNPQVRELLERGRSSVASVAVDQTAAEDAGPITLRRTSQSRSSLRMGQ